MIRVIVPYHLKSLANITGEVQLELDSPMPSDYITVAAQFVSDLVGNFDDNGSASFGNLDIGNFPTPHPSFDVTPYACSRPSLPPITF